MLWTPAVWNQLPIKGTMAHKDTFQQILGLRVVLRPQGDQLTTQLPRNGQTGRDHKVAITLCFSSKIFGYDVHGSHDPLAISNATCQVNETQQWVIVESSLFWLPMCRSVWNNRALGETDKTRQGMGPLNRLHYNQRFICVPYTRELHLQDRLRWTIPGGAPFTAPPNSTYCLSLSLW